MFATKNMDCRGLNVKVRPFPADVFRAKRVEMGKEVFRTTSPVKNNRQQDEKCFTYNSPRRKREVHRSNKAGAKEPGNAQMCNILDLGLWSNSRSPFASSLCNRSGVF